MAAGNFAAQRPGLLDRENGRVLAGLGRDPERVEAGEEIVACGGISCSER